MLWLVEDVDPVGWWPELLLAVRFFVMLNDALDCGWFAACLMLFETLLLLLRWVAMLYLGCPSFLVLASLPEELFKASPINGLFLDDDPLAMILLLFTPRAIDEFLMPELLSTPL